MTTAELDAIRERLAAAKAWKPFDGSWDDIAFGQRAAQDVEALLAEVDRLRGIQPDLGPRAPDGDGLTRYGIRWNGPSQPLSVPMADGYWTPWHLASAAVERQREEVFSALDAVLDRFDCTCGRDDYRHRTSIADGHNPTRCDICNGDSCPKCQLDYALRDAR